MGTVTVNRPQRFWRFDAEAWRRRSREYRLLFRLLMKSPPAAVGLIIVLGYVAIVVYDQFFVPQNDVMIPNFSDTLPRAPFWWAGGTAAGGWFGDRKSTRLNSSHTVISYAVFCLKKK